MFGKNPDFHKVNMHQFCCDSQHAAVAPGAIRLSQPLSHSTGRGEHRRISTLGRKIRASDSNLPCIILSLRSPRALRCQLHKHHSNCCRKKVVTSVWWQVVHQWKKKKKRREGNSLMWKKKKMLQRKSTQHALFSVLAPPIIPTTKIENNKKNRRKQVF